MFSEMYGLVEYGNVWWLYLWYYEGLCILFIVFIWKCLRIWICCGCLVLVGWGLNMKYNCGFDDVNDINVC